jgi:hypothetical protein
MFPNKIFRTVGEIGPEVLDVTTGKFSQNSIERFKPFAQAQLPEKTLARTSRQQSERFYSLVITSIYSDQPPGYGSDGFRLVCNSRKHVPAIAASMTRVQSQEPFGKVAASHLRYYELRFLFSVSSKPTNPNHRLDAFIVCRPVKKLPKLCKSLCGRVFQGILPIRLVFSEHSHHHFTFLLKIYPLRNMLTKALAPTKPAGV